MQCLIEQPFCISSLGDFSGCHMEDNVIDILAKAKDRYARVRAAGVETSTSLGRHNAEDLFEHTWLHWVLRFCKHCILEIL